MREKLQPVIHKIHTCRELLKSEEATKTSLVLPFIQSLGYDIFNPSEVIPEYTCDVGIKKGEKVDYAICEDGIPIILIECKSCATTEFATSSSISEPKKIILSLKSLEKISKLLSPLLEFSTTVGT
jgi:hypothetical protein